ncbi:MAG: endonuclease Q family protein [Candidatus Doudnabacteria bacterium]|nr:endonuclease Q family protein [Candidatus Doudnabacteria bacterium]
MRVIADLQIHSKYSRACSQDLNPGNIGIWADKKGIAVIGTGDVTHPLWLKELKESLEETKPGLYQLKDKSAKAYFMLTAEVSSIYKQGDKVRRIHNMIFAPNFAAVDRIIAGLEKVGANLKSDGRPIMGVKCPDLVKIVLEADTASVVIPAHVWTPHFGLFGSLSGFDTVEEAFGDQSKHIFAIETGLSSDPKMNWQISGLNKYSLVSNSDAHSLRKIGREANVFEISEAKLSYDEIIRVIKDKNPKEFLFTIEFFPEEGKYHLDGHADCKFSCLPPETKKLKGLCPKCGKKLLVGVLNRMDQLGDREFGFGPKDSVPFKNVIPLEEVIAETYGTGVGKKVLEIYEKMTSKYTEFEILLDLPLLELSKISDPMIADSILRIRQGKVHIEGGYDGIFGKIHIYKDKERESLLKKAKQNSLF